MPHTYMRISLSTGSSTSVFVAVDFNRKGENACVALIRGIATSAQEIMTVS
ncbi:unannotated protein [freshwater metagenome]|uniref:Unannotated protein n=1 Tax=freshwater metagenome TaxID=449393 RepID=A0A6J7MIG6_9ZZZZ